MASRTLCQVLKEMRCCFDTRNFSYLLGLIEEAQSMGERMESALYDQDDLRYARKRVKALDKKIEAMEERLENDTTKE